MVIWIGLSAGGVTMVGAVETESCVAVMVPAAGAFALISESGGATPSSAVVLRPEACASVDGVGFGAGADDIAVSDGIPLSRNLLCDGEVAGVAVVSDWSGASAWPAVPSVGSSSAFDTVSWVDDWAPPEDDTVTPGATSTVSDEPLSASVVADVVVPDDEPSVRPGCPSCEGAESAVGSVASVLPSAP
jgi:hypothetical protein